MRLCGRVREWGFAAGGLALSACTVPASGVGDHWKPPSDQWQLVWSDEFEGPAQSAPDPTKWAQYVRGCNYNDEMEFYTDSRNNSYLDGQGRLVIQAIREDYDINHKFTSGRLETLGSMEQLYGAFEARIKLPSGKGLWPAFWLLGNDFLNAQGQPTWPQAGEADILEMHGSNPHQISGAIHMPGFCGGGGTQLCMSGPLSRDFVLPNGGSFADDFHVFRFEWADTGMRWLVDGKSFHERSRANMEKLGVPWVFNHPFFMILNLAVGGAFDGNPIATTVFPQQLIVDYVRVYTLPGMSGPTQGPPRSTASRPDFPNLNCPSRDAGVAPLTSDASTTSAPAAP
ncbi:MAG TPA: glycoside hydrolase family 16 protein [Polyangiaceae bacterium]|nr:glycoside hydrolase family 16 protein [Polyangiaceae bacterium]